jgi:hypothetical protein
MRIQFAKIVAKLPLESRLAAIVVASAGAIAGLAIGALVACNLIDHGFRFDHEGGKKPSTKLEVGSANGTSGN